MAHSPQSEGHVKAEMSIFGLRSESCDFRVQVPSVCDQHAKLRVDKAGKVRLHLREVYKRAARNVQTSSVFKVNSRIPCALAKGQSPVRHSPLPQFPHVHFSTYIHRCT